MKERYDLSRDRIKEIVEESKGLGKYGPFFQNSAEYINGLLDIYEDIKATGPVGDKSLEELRKRNEFMYGDINKDNYLKREDNSTSQDNYEKAQLKLKLSEASFEHTQTLIDLSREQLAKAQIALTIAEKDYSDSTVYAPLTGIVSEKLQEPGEMAATGKPIVVIKDPKDTEVTAYIPAEFYHKVVVAQTPVKIKSFMDIPEDASVTYKSPEISSDLRTFKIKCHSKNTNNLMVPGGLANLTLVLDTHTALAVPTSAIVNRNGGKAIFVVADGKAKLVMLKAGLENEGYTEVTSSELKAGDKVVVKGQHMVNDGQAVTVAGGAK